MILYFIDDTEQYLLPEVRTIRYTEDTFAQVLMDELAQGPKNKAYLNASVNKDIRSSGRLNITLKDTGVLNIQFNVQPYAYTKSSSNGEALSAAAMTYTLTGMMPIQGIEIEVADGKPAACFRKNYTKYTGERITLNFPDKNTTMLTQVQRTVAQSDAQTLQTKMEELIRGPIETDSSDTWPAFPEGVTTEDVLGLTLNGDVVVINFSANFRERVKAMTPNNEVMMVYSIINTMTESDGIKWVQFLFEGEHVDQLSGGINYRHPLMANPGLIRK